MKYFLITFILFFFSSSAFAMSNLPSSEVTGNLIGNSAPEFTLEKLSGSSQTLTQARAGKRAIMIFWAGWCPHCQEELENIRQKADVFKSRGIQIVLVNAGESRQDAKDYLEHQKISLDSFLDEDNTISGLYSIEGIPTVFFIDEKGILRAIGHEIPADYNSKFNSK